MRRISSSIFISFLLFLFSNSQESIHIFESGKYASLGQRSIQEYDTLSGFILLDENLETTQLNKIVFGYHPYWGGSNYLNYQWSLLSDLCYFSYEVDPASGGPDTYHDWLTSPAIDSALAHGTRVHLCVTLFSNHSTFFNNPAARENLTNNLISLLKQRGGQGVSFDFEAVPSSQGENMVNYIGEFASVFRDSIPEGLISIAMPAVDWSGIFDVAQLNNYIDLYMIMGYDYYWNGSTMAGPVDPHYSMTYGYDRSVSRTISYYQSEGMPLEKMLIGVPYYAREWPTASGQAPSNTTGNGDAYTWAKIRNNTSGNYSPDNKKWEPNSFAPYYAFEDGGWYQCFVNDAYSLERRYRLVNSRGLAGIGIWALGYDNGYSDLWEVINQNLTQGSQITWWEEIFDSGGPSWDYYDNEDYVLSYQGEEYEAMRLEFIEFNLETGYDSLWIYNGYYPDGELYGIFTGNELPPVMYAMNANNAFSIRFKSDHSTTTSGWKAVIENFTISIVENEMNVELSASPNPTNSILYVNSSLSGELYIYDINGKLTYKIHKDKPLTKLDLSDVPDGIYFLEIKSTTQATRLKFIKN